MQIRIIKEFNARDLNVLESISREKVCILDLKNLSLGLTFYNYKIVFDENEKVIIIHLNCLQ